MSATRVGVISTAILTFVFSFYYQLFLKDILTHAGYWRTVEALNNKLCITHSELQACEKIVLHHPSGVLYLACSTPSSRMAWEPSLGRFNASARSLTDYVATYDPSTSEVTRLKVIGFPSSVPLALHGLDVVPSDENPAELFVYLINHRPPQGDPKRYGADSVVEIFKTKVGGNELFYMATIEDPLVMILPNDLIGYGDGRSFHFTNDNRSKLGFMRTVDFYFRLSRKSVGYCHVNQGCKFAATDLRGAKGIARDKDGKYLITNNMFGEIFVLEKQDDETLVLTDVLKSDMPMNSISVDEAGVLYIAASPTAIKSSRKFFKDWTVPSPSSVLRLSPNTGLGKFYGEKYKIEKVFEDDGMIANTITSVAWDGKRKTLYLSGSSISICEIDNI